MGEGCGKNENASTLPVTFLYTTYSPGDRRLPLYSPGDRRLPLYSPGDRRLPLLCFER